RPLDSIGRLSTGACSDPEGEGQLASPSRYLASPWQHFRCRRLCQCGCEVATYFLSLMIVPQSMRRVKVRLGSQCRSQFRFLSLAELFSPRNPRALGCG